MLEVRWQTSRAISGVSLALGFWPDVGKGLKRKPEPTPEQLKKVLKQIEALDLNYVYQAVLKNLSRKLPPFPPGKQPTFSKLQERQDIESEVQRLASRLSRKEAYKNVAKKRDVHWRTIQNLCLKGKQKRESEDGDDETKSN